MGQIKLSNSFKSIVSELKKNQEAKQESWATTFIADLYYSIEQDAIKHKKTPSKTFKPSSMKCCRNMQFQVMGVEPEEGIVNIGMIGILENGTDRHLRIQNYIMSMKDNGIDCEYLKVGEYVKEQQSNGKLLDLEIIDDSGVECKLYNHKYNISFMCDGLIRYKGKLFILEIKTEASFKNANRKEMAEEHLPQVCAYYLCFDIPDVMMLYENRDTCEKKVYHKVVTHKEVFDNVIEKIEIVNSNIASGEISEGTIGKHCNYCAYRTKCKKLGGCHYELR